MIKLQREVKEKSTQLLMLQEKYSLLEEVITAPLQSFNSGFKHLYLWRLIVIFLSFHNVCKFDPWFGECGGSVLECQTPERDVEGSKSTSAVL